MNWEHLRAFLWLRFRIAVNFGKKEGIFAMFLDTLIKIVILVGVIGAFIIGIILGLVAMYEAQPVRVMMIWDVLLFMCIFFLMIGVMTELQSTDILSLDKFMHLPVSMNGAFMVNYLASCLTLGVLTFLGMMLGIVIGSVVSNGVKSVLLVPLILGFFIMVTALIFQFKRWLASMITNPKRRQTIIVMLTMGFVLVMMSPAFLGMLVNKKTTTENPDVVTQGQQESDAEQGQRRRRGGPFNNLSMSERQLLVNRVQFANTVLPPGWLAHGAVSLHEGRLLPLLLCITGMTLIGGFSLQRSFRTTMDMYQGKFSSGQAGTGSPESEKKKVAPGKKRKGNLEWLFRIRFPGISDRASAIFTAGIISMCRIPQVKMLLLTPVIILIIFSGFIANMKVQEELFMPTLTAMGMVLFAMFTGLVGIISNLFAFDRDGYRLYILSSVPRRDILLGKNLALLPVAFLLSLVTILVCAWLRPIRFDHLLGLLIQSFSMFFLLCMVGNLTSILVPLIVKPASGMPVKGQGIKTLIQAVATLLFPFIVLVTLIPLGIEYLMFYIGWFARIPPFLVLEGVLLAVVLWLYSFILDWQGELLHAREHKVLDVVTLKLE